MDDEFGPAAMATVVGDLAELARILAEEPDLATRRSSVSHPTLLQLVACEAPNIVDPVGAAQLLMEAGAATQDPLVAAAGCGSGSVLEFMLDKGAEINPGGTWTPLDEALYWAQDETAKILVERGARTRALSTAAGLGEVHVIEQFFVGGALLAHAGPIGSPFVETIGERGDDPQAIIDHAFVMAVNNGRRPAAEALVDRGARINEIPPGYHWRGTALHAAVWRGDTDLVRWLLSCGADPSIRDRFVDGDALGWAQHHQHAHLLEVLSRS